MPISYLLTMPASPGFRSAVVEIADNTTVHGSPLTRDEQLLQRAGALWSAQYALPPMERADAAAWVSFLTKLQGRVGTFYAFDPSATSPRGSAGGAPAVDGAAQTGNDLATKGWPISTPGVLLAGDYIEVAGRYHMVLDDADSDGTGDAALVIAPPLRESPADSAAITVTNPRVIMRLADDRRSWSISDAKHLGIAFNAVEDL